MTDTDTIAREFPHAQGPEKSVLSTLMREPHRIEEATLDRRMFYLPGHAIIYDDIEAERSRWELVSAVERLHQKGLLESVGGPGAISDIYTYAPHPQFFDQHIAILRDRMARRLAIVAAAAISQAAYDCSDEQNYLAALSNPVTAVFDAAAAATAPKDTKALLADFLARYEAKLRGEQPAAGIPTGIHEIDRTLRGLVLQHMGIISARTEGGKSTLATQIAGNLAAAGVASLYLILERTEDSVTERAVIQQAGVHHGAVKDPIAWAELQGHARPDRETLIRIKRAIETIGNGHLHIRKPDNRRLQTIVAEIRRYVRLHKVKVVFLDQIGLVRGERVKGDNGEAELRGISNTLQELAHELGFCLIVMSQVNNEGETKNARAIEEDADWHLSIIQEMDRKKENFRQHLHVLVAKDSHNGKGGTRLPLILCRETLLFYQGEPDLPEAPPKPKGRSAFAQRRFPE